MAKVDVTVSVEKSGMDLLQHLGHLVKAIKSSGGFTPTAIPADVAALVADLPAMVSDVGQISGEVSEDKAAFSKGVVLGAFDFADSVLSK